MKAKTLREAIRKLNPEHALRTSDELQDYFVERPLSPLRRLEVLLEDNRDEPQKILFTGHRGSGKTTELAKLAEKLREQFFIIHCSAERHLNLFDLTYTDVILSLGLELFGEARARGIPVKESVARSFEDFTKKITIEVETGEKKEKEGQAGCGLGDIATLTGKYKTEDSTRTTIRKTLEHCLQELFENIDFLSQEIKTHTKKPVLAVVEDLDKTDIKTAEELFGKHATSLLAPPITIIYTFPIELRFNNNYMHINSSYSRVETLPNIKICHCDGSADEEGRQILKNILTRRMAEGLISEAAEELLVENSGGIPRELVALARLACLEARVAGKEMIDREEARQAVQGRRREYDVLLPDDQRRLLREVEEKKWVDNDEKFQPLLNNLSALEYRNEEVWYDVHPLVKPLLRKRTA